MKNYTCNKCGSIDVFIDERGSQNALMCGDCGSWLKWISKKEISLVKRFIKENKFGQAEVKSFEEDIYFHRDKEDNWDIRDKAEKKSFKNASDLRWLGLELELRIEVREDSKHKILSVNGVDVSDKEICV